MFFLVYPLAISWQRSTLNNSSLPTTKAPWLGLTGLGKTSLSLLQSNFDMHLYSTLQQEMGLKSTAVIGGITLGMSSSLVLIPLFEHGPFREELLYSLIHPLPYFWPACFEKTAINPSGLGDLHEGIEKIASLISFSEKGAINFSCYSTLSLPPFCIISVSILSLWVLCFPNSPW